MALIKCPECDREVSDKATSCIHCGYPLSTRRNELIIKGKRTTDVVKKHIYFLYKDGEYFDEILPGDVKKYTIDNSFYLVLGHKRGSFINCAISDSTPVKIDPTKTIRLEASIGQGFMPSYLLSEVDMIDSE